MVVCDPAGIDIRLGEDAAGAEGGAVQAQGTVGHVGGDGVGQPGPGVVHIALVQHGGGDDVAGGALGHRHAGIGGHDGRIVDRGDIHGEGIAGRRVRLAVVDRESEAGIGAAVGIGRGHEDQVPGIDVGGAHHLVQGDVHPAELLRPGAGQGGDLDARQGIAVHIAEAEVAGGEGVGRVLGGGDGVVAGCGRIVDWDDIEAGRAGHRIGTIGDGIAEADCAVVIGRRGIGPGAVTVVDQGAGATRNRQGRSGQGIVLDVRGVGQQLGVGDHPRAAVLGDGRQGDRAGGRGVVDRGDIEAGRAGHRIGAIGDGIAEADRAVVIGRRGIGPGAITVVDQGAGASRNRQGRSGQGIVLDIRGVGQQFGLGDHPRAAVLGDGGQGHRGGGRRIVDRSDIHGEGIAGRRVRLAVVDREAEAGIGVAVGIGRRHEYQVPGGDVGGAHHLVQGDVHPAELQRPGAGQGGDLDARQGIAVHIAEAEVAAGGEDVGRVLGGGDGVVAGGGRIVDCIDRNRHGIRIRRRIAVGGQHRQGVSAVEIGIALIGQRGQGGIDIGLTARQGQVG